MKTKHEAVIARLDKKLRFESVEVGLVQDARDLLEAIAELQKPAYTIDQIIVAVEVGMVGRPDTLEEMTESVVRWLQRGEHENKT